MNKIVLIQPYFGKFPNYFQLHLNSIMENKEIIWLFFTDDYTYYNWPKNTVVHYWTFNRMKEYIQTKFEFPIALNEPYKLCDFRPAYGYIFQEYIRDYDFWGHCDVDVIWGDIKKFVTEDLLDKYEFIYREGAFRLYKNVEKINNIYRCPGSLFGYKEVFSTSVGFGFDEALSIQRIAEKNKVKIYHNDNAVADIDAFTGPLYIRRVAKKRWKNEAGIFRDIVNYKYQIFEYDHGRIIRYFIHENKIGVDEFMYIHLLKRHMDMDQVVSVNDDYLIVPNSFIGMQTRKELNVHKIISLSCADSLLQVFNGKLKETTYRKIMRKCKVLLGMKPAQRRVILKKRLYFFYEFFMYDSRK